MPTDPSSPCHPAFTACALHLHSSVKHAHCRDPDPRHLSVCCHRRVAVHRRGAPLHLEGSAHRALPHAAGLASQQTHLCAAIAWRPATAPPVFTRKIRVAHIYSSCTLTSVQCSGIITAGLFAGHRRLLKLPCSLQQERPSRHSTFFTLLAKLF